MTPQEYFEKKVGEVLKNQDKWEYKIGDAIEYPFKNNNVLGFSTSFKHFVFKLGNCQEIIYDWFVDIAVNAPKQFLDAKELLINKRKEHEEESELRVLNKLIETMEE